jgi:hypothetical protein
MISILSLSELWKIIHNNFLFQRHIELVTFFFEDRFSLFEKLKLSEFLKNLKI